MLVLGGLDADRAQQVRADGRNTIHPHRDHRPRYRLDVNTLHRDEAATSLRLNEIARVTLRTQQPVMFDSYRRNRETGSFILIDEATNKTVGAGMITAPVSHDSHIVWQTTKVGREHRPYAGATVWLTGLSGSGKSSLAMELERRFVAEGRPAYLMDGDNLRHGLNSDLGFGDDDRRENIRRTAEVAALFADSGSIAIVSLISPFVTSAPERGRSMPNAGCRSSRSSSTPPSTNASGVIRKGCTPSPTW